MNTTRQTRPTSYAIGQRRWTAECVRGSNTRREGFKAGMSFVSSLQPPFSALDMHCKAEKFGECENMRF